MLLKDLLPGYLFWAPRSKKPMRITSPLSLHTVIGKSRTYCYDAWAGKIPMTKKVALLLHTLSRKTLPLEKLFAIDPQEWPTETMNRLAASRARRQGQAGEAERWGVPAVPDQTSDAA